MRNFKFQGYLFLVIAATGCFSKKKESAGPPSDASAVISSGDSQGSGSSGDGSTDPTPTPAQKNLKIDFSSNFAGNTTGYYLPTTGSSKDLGAPAAVSFTLIEAADSLESLECRGGPKKLIEQKSWTPCSWDRTMTVSSMSDSPSRSGTFVAQVRGVDSSGEHTAVQSKEFYVHPSLNDAKACVDSVSDEDLFSLAGGTLPQEGQFGEGSKVSGPFYRIEGISSAPVEFVSFRKSLVMNQDRSLMLVKRRVRSSGNAAHCNVASVAKQREVRFQSAYQLEANGDIRVSTNNRYISFSKSEKTTETDTNSQTITEAGSPTLFQSIMTYLTDRAWTSVGVEYLRARQIQYRGYESCRYLVFNADGDGVCIESDLKAFNIKHYGALSGLRRTNAPKAHVTDYSEALSSGVDANLTDLREGYIRVYFED